MFQGTSVTKLLLLVITITFLISTINSPAKVFKFFNFNFLRHQFEFLERYSKTNKVVIVSSVTIFLASLIYTFGSTSRLPTSLPSVFNKIFTTMTSGYRYLNPNENRLRTSKFSREVNFAMKNGGEIGGISNDGNTCFMNSVLQSLASSRHLLKFIDSYLYQDIEIPQSNGNKRVLTSNTPKSDLVFTAALRKFLEGINGSYGSKGKEFSSKYLLNKMPNGPKQNFFTGYNQEDAQEFYQLVMGLLEKEYKKVSQQPTKTDELVKTFEEKKHISNLISGCEKLGNLGKVYVPAAQVDPNLENRGNLYYPLNLVTPVDGITADRIGCLACGEVGGIRYSVSSGLSLNLPARSTYGARYDLNDLIKHWITPEIIDDVNCNRCGLIQTKEFLESKLDSSTSEKVSEQFRSRIYEIDNELKKAHITDEIFEKLSIKQMIRKTRKSKEIVFSRPPPLLAIHINRSVFDPRTYMIVKNPSTVSFPSNLNLNPYVIEPKDINMDARFPFRKSSSASELVSEKADDSRKEKMGSDSTDDELESLNHSNVSERSSFAGDEDINPALIYQLKAVICHFGTHNYGHYICYRRLRGSWWRISDESVYVVNESEVLNSQGTFMLFYEYNDGFKEYLQQVDDIESDFNEMLSINLSNSTKSKSPQLADETSNLMDSKSSTNEITSSAGNNDIANSATSSANFEDQHYEESNLETSASDSPEDGAINGNIDTTIDKQSSFHI